MRTGWVPERQAEKRSRSANENARHKAWRFGVDDGNRTHDTRSHNPVLYQLSYAHHIVNRAGRSGQRPDKPSLKVVRTERLELTPCGAGT